MSSKPTSTTEHDKDKTREQLLSELQELRAQVASLRGSEVKSKSVTESLRESEGRLLLAQQVADIGTFEWNIQSGVNTWTPELEAMYGLPPGGFPGTQEAWEQLVHPEDRPEAVRRVREAIDKGGFECEWRVVWPDGTIHWLYGRAFVFKDESGKPLKLIGINIDITERKRLEESLKLTQFALDNFRDSAIWFSMDGSIIYVNDEACKSLGYAREELLSMHIRDIDPDVDYPQCESIWNELKQRNGFGKFEQRHVARDRRVFPVDVTACYVRYGEKEHIISFDRDITERKRAEEALRESEEKYRRIIEMANEGIWMLDQDNLTTFVNPKMARMLGYSQEEIVVRAPYDFLDDVYREEVRIHLNNRRRGASEQFICKFLRKDGSDLWAIVSGTPLYDSNGAYTGAMAMIMDITERKRAEDVNRRLAGIVETSIDGITVQDFDGNVLAWNHGAEAIYGYSKAEAIESGISIIIPDGRVEEIKALGDDLKRGAENRSIETRRRTKDGRILDIWLTLSTLKDDYGNPYAFTTIERNITERKRAEEDRKRLIRELGKRVKELGALHRVYDIIQKGRSAPEVLQEIADILPPAWQYPEVTAARIALDGQEYRTPNFLETPWKQRADFRTSDGEHGAIEVYYLKKRPDEAEGQFLSEERDLINSLAEMLRTYLDKIYAEESLTEAKKQAENYLDLMSHDINNLNQVAIGYLELAEEMLEDKELRELVSRPLDAINSSSHLIENVNKLKKLKAGVLTLEAIDLDKVLNELRSHYSKVPDKEVTIGYRGPDSTCNVMANGLITDLFSNLVWNAIRHSDRLSVEINMELKRLEEDGKEYYKVVVEDNGPGIPDALKESIFAKFQRGNTKTGGKGLGLYLVRTLVDDFHGRVWVEDHVPGDNTKGARFVVMLPAVDQ